MKPFKFRQEAMFCASMLSARKRLTSVVHDTNARMFQMVRGYCVGAEAVFYDDYLIFSIDAKKDRPQNYFGRIPESLVDTIKLLVEEGIMQ